MSKKLISSIAAATLGASTLVAPTLYAGETETEANFSANSIYLFRGLDANNGAAQVTGDLNFSHETGLHAGVWAGSAAGGQEFDITLGYAVTIAEDFNLGFGAIHYQYPESKDSNGNEDTWGNSGTNDESYLTLGFQDYSLSYYVNNNDGDETYTQLSAGFAEKYTAVVGIVDAGDPKDGGTLAANGTKDIYTHVDLSYQANENFSFTASKIVDQDDDVASSQEDDLRLVVTYSMPIEL